MERHGNCHDDITGDYFTSFVEKRYGKSGMVEGYESQSPEYVKLENGNNAMIIYSTYAVSSGNDASSYDRF